jgi:hypothetical protein
MPLNTEGLSELGCFINGFPWVGVGVGSLELQSFPKFPISRTLSTLALKIHYLRAFTTFEINGPTRNSPAREVSQDYRNIGLILNLILI